MSLDKNSCLFVGSSLPCSRVQLVIYLALSPALSSAEFTDEELSTWIYAKRIQTPDLTTVKSVSSEIRE